MMPQTLAEEDGKDSEEDAGDLMPQGADGMGKRPPESTAKAAAATSDAAGDVSRRGARIDPFRRRTLLYASCGLRRSGRARGSGRFCRRRGFLRPLADHFGCDAGANTKFAA